VHNYISFLLKAALDGAIYTAPDPEETIIITLLMDWAEDALETCHIFVCTLGVERTSGDQCVQVYEFLLEAALHGAIYTGPDPEETIAWLRDQAEDALET